MKLKRTITQELSIDKIGPFSYIERPESTLVKSFILLNKDIPNNLEDLWRFRDYKNCFSYRSNQYLLNYREGAWWFRDENYYDNLIMLMKGHFKNFFKGNAGFSGFIFDIKNQPLLRKIECRFHQDYYDLTRLEKILRSKNQWSDISFKDQTMIAKYLPKQNQLNKWVNLHHSASLGAAGNVIQDFSYISSLTKALT